MQRDELAGWLRLALNPGLGPQAARKLLAAFGLPPSIFAQDDATLAQVVGARAGALRKDPAGFDELLDTTLAWLAKDPDRREVLTLGDAGYPQALLAIEDPPLMLYRMGLLVDAPQRALAVVGSRNPTPQGLQNARRFSRAFAEAGVSVVSGLALGIDGAAHEGALEGAGPAAAMATIAVVGTGLDRVYPQRHLALARRIARDGLIVGEYTLGTPPLSANFPRRNRLIAGLARGTLVVEAALRSGSLITARMAVEAGREVFAIPGSIHSPQSRGCHALIRQGAKLVETAAHVLEELRLDAPVPAAESDPGAPRSGRRDAVLDALGHDPVTLDALAARTGWPPSELSAHLLDLELSGEVARLPGQLFQRLVRA